MNEVVFCWLASLVLGLLKFFGVLYIDWIIVFIPLIAVYLPIILCWMYIGYKLMKKTDDGNFTNPIKKAKKIVHYINDDFHIY